MLLELSDALAAMTLLALLGTLILTGPLSLLLLLLYRRAVLRGMQLRGTDSRTAPSVADTDPLSPTTSPATLSLAADAGRTRRGGEELYEEARRRQTRMAARHALAGAVYGAAWFTGAMWLLPDEMTPGGVAVLVIASLFPGLLAWTSVKEPGRFAWLIWVAYFAGSPSCWARGRWRRRGPRRRSCSPMLGPPWHSCFSSIRSCAGAGSRCSRLLVLASSCPALRVWIVIALIILGLGGGGAFEIPP